MMCLNTALPAWTYGARRRSANPAMESTFALAVEATGICQDWQDLAAQLQSTYEVQRCVHRLCIVDPTGTLEMVFLHDEINPGDSKGEPGLIFKLLLQFYFQTSTNPQMVV